MASVAWQFDTVHSHISFTVRHLLVSKVRGHFATWRGSLQLDEANLAGSSVEIEIDAASIDTAEAKRDAHLRSADFFDTETFPKIVFKSTSVEVVDAEHFKVHGDLSMHGVTQPVTLAVEAGGVMAKDPYGLRRAGFSATATIDRKAFGVSWNQALDHGGVAVSDKVALALDVEVFRPADAA